MSCPVDTHGTRCKCSGVKSEPAPAPEPAKSAEVVLCDCKPGQKATVRLKLLPRPLPLFGESVKVLACPACYAEKCKRGQLLHQEPIPEEAS